MLANYTSKCPFNRGENWYNEKRLTYNYSLTANPQLASNNGIVWEDYRHGNREIYFCKTWFTDNSSVVTPSSIKSTTDIHHNFNKVKCHQRITKLEIYYLTGRFIRTWNYTDINRVINIHHLPVGAALFINNRANNVNCVNNIADLPLLGLFFYRCF